MSIETLFTELKNSPNYENQIVHIEKLPRQEPTYGLLDSPLSLQLQSFLNKREIQLYTHQTEAINEIRQSNDIIITTPTASGKIFAYTLPIFEEL